MSTKIEWVQNPDGTRGETWNPVTGCTKISAGCEHCYAERMARRLAGRFGYPEAPHHFDVTLHPDRLDEPLHWRKPRMVFVCSMSDLFHKSIGWDYMRRVFDVMIEADQHIFQVLTKRAVSMWDFLRENYPTLDEDAPHIWGMVTAENQAMADRRIPDLLRCPFAVRGVSLEPMLGEMDLSPWLDPCADLDPLYAPTALLHCQGLDWVIVGGESGPGARPMHPNWARQVRDQCLEAGVPYFFKQHGAWIHESQLEDAGLHTTYDASDCDTYYRVGKHEAGRLLDGREWNEMPEGVRA